MGQRRRSSAPGRALVVCLAVVISGALQGCASPRHPGSPSAGSQQPALASGTPAPAFSLTDQFGRAQQLSDFRGHVVLLTFIDSHCTTVCPLTAELMTKTEQTLGPAHPVQLLAINANPDFTSVSDVRRWSIRHRMLRRWLFLTGPALDLRAAWSNYGIQDKVMKGDVAHTALIFLIDAKGDVRALFPIAARDSMGPEASYIARVVRTVATSGA